MPMASGALAEHIIARVKPWYLVHGHPSHQLVYLIYFIGILNRD